MIDEKQKEISIVVPLFNEEENVEKLHAEILQVCRNNHYLFEIIFVDDGSTDETFERSKTLSPLKIIRLRKNFGQTAAFDAGIKSAKYNYIITMDGDCQNDPNDIPLLITTLEKNRLDVVSGWREKRKDTLTKRFISRGAHTFRRFLIKDHIHDSGCSLKIYKKECFDGLSLYGEMHRFIPALLMGSGYQVGETVVNHRPRHKGVSKYNWKRAIKGIVDMMSIAFWHKFASRPLHFLGGLGLLLIFLGFSTGAVTVYNFLTGQGMSETAWPLLTVFFFLAGVQFFVSGLIIDVLLRNHYETTQNQVYSIKEIWQNNASENK
ncbi:MAG: glycosyltransferase family 2 protein [Desulfobacteraceae bacterium]|nr:glycosyltransferase family 2 protein [Desulfobacteraceae bacterium]MBC2757888.1 glycosyltransferase family 2 protein [Desulfobacteraceae bacterium]